MFWAASLNISQTSWLGGYFPCIHSCSAVCRTCRKGRKGAGSIVLVTSFVHEISCVSKGYTCIPYLYLGYIIYGYTRPGKLDSLFCISHFAVSQEAATDAKQGCLALLRFASATCM